MFMALALYKKRHGSVQSLLLLSNTSSSNDPSSRLAAIWLRYQVLNRYHLAKDQVQKLSSLGYPGIQGDLQTMTARNTPAEVILEYMYAKLLAFQREFGHTQVPTDWERDPAFAKWVMEQRLKMENQTLSQEHCHLLGQLGFEWSLEQVHPTASTAAEAVAADSTAESNVFPDDDEWMVNFQKLVLFQSKYKHCDVPLVLEQDHTFSDRHKSFSEWVLQQHLLHLNNNLPPKRRKLLDKIGFFEPEIAGIHTNKKKRAQPDPGEENETGTDVVDLTDCDDDDGDDNRKGQQPTQKKSKTDQHTSEEMLQYSKSYIAKLRAKVGLTTLKMTSTLGSKNKSMATNTAAAASVPNREAAVSPARGPPKRRSEKSGPTAGNKQPSTTTASGMGMMMTNEPTAMSSLGHNDNARPTSSSTRNAKITHGTSSTMNAKIMAEQQQKYQHFLKQQQQQQQQPASAPPPSDVAAVSKEQNDKETTNENNNKHTAWYMMEKLGDENRHLQEQLQRQTEDLHRHQDDLRRKDAVIAYLKQQLQEKDRYIESVTDMEDAIFLF